MPPQIDEEAVMRLMSLDKDVDGFHPINVGLLAMKGRDPLFTPATPTGCMVLLERAGAKLEGANAVVIGRSNLVGMPVVAHAHQSQCDRHTLPQPHAQYRRRYSAGGYGDRRDWQAGVRARATGSSRARSVIDVGTNKIDDPSDKRGYRFVGDVDFEGAPSHRRGDHQSAGRRRSDDDHHAAPEHFESRVAARRKGNNLGWNLHT